MQALYWQRPTAGEASDLGMRLSDYPEPLVEIWPESWPAFDLYTQISTQWRVGYGGPTGLDYTVVYHELDRRNLDRETYDEMLAALRVIERAALTELHKD